MNYYEYRANWYALFLSIVNTDMTADEAIMAMNGSRTQGNWKYEETKNLHKNRKSKREKTIII